MRQPRKLEEAALTVLPELDPPVVQALVDSLVTPPVLLVPLVRQVRQARQARQARRVLRVRQVPPVPQVVRVPQVLSHPPVLPRQSLVGLILLELVVLDLLDEVVVLSLVVLRLLPGLPSVRTLLDRWSCWLGSLGWRGCTRGVTPSTCAWLGI